MHGAAFDLNEPKGYSMIERVWIIGIGDGPPNMAFLTKEAADQCAELLVEVTK